MLLVVITLVIMRAWELAGHMIVAVHNTYRALYNS